MTNKTGVRKEIRKGRCKFISHKWTSETSRETKATTDRGAEDYMVELKAEAD
jgi:hypothetical protein